MITSTAPTDRLPSPHPAPVAPRPGTRLRAELRGIVLLLFTLLMTTPRADTVLGPWTPIFKGIELAYGTNTPGIGALFSNQHVVRAVRINLADPDVQLLPSPRIANYLAGNRETAGYQVKDYLALNKLQLAVNGGFFDPGTYYLPAGTPMDPDGLLISRGTNVSAQGFNNSAAIFFATNNQARIIPTNYPPNSTAGVLNALSGDYAVVINGVNVGRQYTGAGGQVHQVNPRTAYGLSQDGWTLYILAIDGRQPGYSVGALDWETGGWMLLLGAHNAINMDGGGSTTLVMADSIGNPVELNHPSAVADSGKERTVGSHLGFYAKPAPAFLNDIAVQADDTAAVVTWNTTEPATSQVAFGPTTDLGTTTSLDPALVKQHAVLISGLQPGTPYYFTVSSTTTGKNETSALQQFETTNYVTLATVFEVDHAWKYSTANLDGMAWTAPLYDDTAWSGPGAGLLWIDVRATGPNVNVQPKGEPLPADPNNNGFPYVTYYFRTHFTEPAGAMATGLSLLGYFDDGVVFYLNGHEILRHEMPAAPEVIANDTLATGYYCSDGDATCPVEYELGATVAAYLQVGDNLLAAEAHNYSARSPDITFGLALTVAESAPPVTQLAIGLDQGVPVLSWTRPAMILQHALTPQGPWADVPGPVFTSPYRVTGALGGRYFRLRR